MKKMAPLLIIVAIFIVGISVFLWTKNNLTRTPVDKGPVINKICNGFPTSNNSSYSNTTVIQYQNDEGVIGGYGVDVSLRGEEFWGFLYDANGQRVNLGVAYETASVSARNELTTKAREWVAAIEREYPIKKEFRCDR